MKINSKVVFISIVLLICITAISFAQPVVKADSSKTPQIRFVMQIYDITPSTKSASVNIVMFVDDFPYNVSSLTEYLVGDVDVHVICNQSGSNLDGTYYFQGQSNQTSCFLEGSGQFSRLILIPCD
jgi:hypothetical protein